MSDLPTVRDQLTEEEIEYLPILFGPFSDWRTADRMAGFWEATGFRVLIRPLEHQYVLILDLPPEH